MRLDQFLTERLPEFSRSQIAKRLKKGLGMVNGKLATVHAFLKQGDEVKFEDAEEAKAVAAALPPPPLKIIEETADWMVLNKQAGIVVHPDATHTSGTLADGILAYLPKIAKVGDDPNRPGIMHRLDREVSGLMVIAKTQDAYDNLKKQFAQHSVEKRYLALVYGTVNLDEGDLKFRIARSKTKNRMAARPQGEEVGKAAWTHYKTLKRFIHASLLELTILSGRTHQIRAHMLAFNHPVIGDPLYKRTQEDRRVKAPRIMLQSVHLAFNDPATGELRSFDLEPAADFKQLMDTFKIA